jgi:dienelactone hydrolase
LAVLAVLVAGAAAAQRRETVEVASLTLTNEQFLAGDTKGGVPVTLSGLLRLPGDDVRYPAVVLLHGSGGLTNSPVGRWDRTLRAIGVATFSLDSFTGRGITEVQSDQRRLGLFQQIYDAYRAIDVLAVHPRIDSKHIALMGFSRGGTAALYAAMTRLQRSFGPKNAYISAYLPFYPACNFELVGELEVANAPIREFHGAADNWTLPGPCRSYINRLAAAGHDAIMTEYSGAGHSFDEGPGVPWVIESAVTSRSCHRVEVNGTLFNRDTGKPFTWDDACVERGVSGGYDGDATVRAEESVKELLTGLFSLTRP